MVNHTAMQLRFIVILNAAVCLQLLLLPAKLVGAYYRGEATYYGPDYSRKQQAPWPPVQSVVRASKNLAWKKVNWMLCFSTWVCEILCKWDDCWVVLGVQRRRVMDTTQPGFRTGIWWQQWVPVYMRMELRVGHRIVWRALVQVTEGSTLALPIPPSWWLSSICALLVISRVDWLWRSRRMPILRLLIRTTPAWLLSNSPCNIDNFRSNHC